MSEDFYNGVLYSTTYYYVHGTRVYLRDEMGADKRGAGGDAGGGTLCMG